MTGCERLLRLYTTAPNAFWRHDIDISLDAAAKMGRLAQLAGVTATFYVMLRGEFYNPFSQPGQDALKAIAGCGHRIGLHVDYRTGDVHNTVLQDQILAADLDDVDPGLVSFHRPPPAVLWRDFDGFSNAYASRWLGQYVSDSRREWTDEKEAQVRDDMQIALHPEHWF